jgi:hypothetical protein
MKLKSNSFSDGGKASAAGVEEIQKYSRQDVLSNVMTIMK